MKRISLPEPPNPAEAQYKDNPMSFMRAVSEWARITKGTLEQASAINDTPMDTPFSISGTFALNTTVTGTMTGTDVSNWICSFVAAMQRKGSISPTGPKT